MEALSASDIFQFDRFHLDRRGLFRRDGGAGLAPVEVGARALDVLRVLLKRPGELVSRDEIMAAAWPGIVVEDNNLTIQIAALRHVLDQERANGSCIQTVPRRGYRFVAQVVRAEPAGTSEPGSPPGNGIDGPITEREQAQAVGTRGKTVRAAFALSNARYGLWAGAVAMAIGALDDRCGDLAHPLALEATPGAALVNCRAALCQSRRRSRATIFCRRHHRGCDVRSFADRRYVRHLAQYRIRLPQQAHQH